MDIYQDSAGIILYILKTLEGLQDWFEYNDVILVCTLMTFKKKWNCGIKGKAKNEDYIFPNIFLSVVTCQKSNSQFKHLFRICLININSFS